MYQIIALFLLATSFLGKFKKVFPFFVALFFGFNIYSDLWAIKIGGMYLEICYLISFVFLIKAIILFKNDMRNNIAKILFYMVIINFIYIVIRWLLDDLDVISVYKFSRTLILQSYIFVAFIYCMRYDYNKLIYYFFIGSWIHIIVVILNTFKEDLGFYSFHNATLGIAIGYIVAYNLIFLKNVNTFYFKKLFYYLGFMSIFLPLLGMGRSAIIGSLIPFILYNKKKYKKLLIYPILFVIILIFADFIIEYASDYGISYFHQGSRNLNDMFVNTTDLSTISTRLIRWEFIWDNFKDNMLFGVGFTQNKISDAYNFYGLNETSFRNIWQAHNFYLAVLGGGGLFLFIPNFILLLLVLKKIISTIFNKNANLLKVFGAILILEIININFTNCYYASFWAAPFMWGIFGLGLYLIIYKNKFV